MYQIMKTIFMNPEYNYYSNEDNIKYCNIVKALPEKCPNLTNIFKRNNWNIKLCQKRKNNI